MRRQLRVACLLSAMFMIPAAAEAAPRSGLATDPREEGVGLDARQVEVTYDRGAGRLAASVQLDSATNPDNFGGRFMLSVGRLRRDGRCATASTSSLRMDSTLIWDMTYGDLWRAGFPADTRVSAEVRESFPDYTYTFEAAWLKRKSYRCVTDIRLESSGTDVDTIQTFVLKARRKA